MSRIVTITNKQLSSPKCSFHSFWDPLSTINLLSFQFYSGRLHEFMEIKIYRIAFLYPSTSWSACFLEPAWWLKGTTPSCNMPSLHHWVLKPQHSTDKENNFSVFACFVSNVWHSFPLAGKKQAAFFRRWRNPVMLAPSMLVTASSYFKKFPVGERRGDPAL